MQLPAKSSECDPFVVFSDRRARLYFIPTGHSKPGGQSFGGVI
jgi:hypothetical protein